MKKFLILVSLILSTLIVQAQDSTAIKTYDHIKGDLVKLFEGPGKHLLELSQKQIIVDAWINIIISILIISVIIWVWKATYAKCKQDYDYPYEEPLLIFVAIFSVATVLIAFCVGTNQITYLLNPEYYAIKEILGVLK